MATVSRPPFTFYMGGGGAPPGTDTRVFPGRAESVREARVFVAALMGHSPAAADAALLTSELVTNAIQHASAGGSAIVLRLETAGGWLRIEVHDADPCEPTPRPLSVLEESGFGLVLVEAMADKWGVRQPVKGKAVWAELDTQPAAG